MLIGTLKRKSINVLSCNRDSRRRRKPRRKRISGCWSNVLRKNGPDLPLQNLLPLQQHRVLLL